MPKFVKCPRCDLNYMPVGEKYCKVCMEEVRGDRGTEDVEMCSVCKEFPALPGRDVCLMCLKDMEGTPSEEENEAQAAMIAAETEDEETTEDADAAEIPEDEELNSKLRDAESELKSVEDLVE